MPKKPLCFVLMPFGTKTLADNRSVDFNYAYNQLIKPAIEAAGLEPIRADEEKTDGIIHKPMFERLILCEYAVADLSASNANVFYELGVRHAIKPFTTTIIFEGANRLPFDVNLLRGLPYYFDEKGLLKDLEATKKQLTDKLLTAKANQDKDSPVFQLLDGFPEIAHLKTDVFREQVEYAEKIKEALRKARNKKSKEEIKAIEDDLGNLKDVEAGILVDLFLSYRSIEAYDEMIVLIEEKFPKHISNTIMMREQYAFALNRKNKGSQEAIDVLNKLIDERGASSETYGLMGRIYKDRWSLLSKQAGSELEAESVLEQAIETYSKGFSMDSRDAFPGINAISLMEIKDPPDERMSSLLPVVKFAVEQKMKSKTPDYWDYATLLEIAVLEKNQSAAKEALKKSIPAIGEQWAPKSTINNLQLIREAREKRGEDVKWQIIYEDELLKKTK